MYLKISDSAMGMGTKMTSSYLNISVVRLEGCLLHHYKGKPFSWLRFINDIEMKSVDVRKSFVDFITIANSFYYSIKFIVKIFTSKNIFLYHNHNVLYTGKLSSIAKLSPSALINVIKPHTFIDVSEDLATPIRNICSSLTT